MDEKEVIDILETLCAEPEDGQEARLDADELDAVLEAIRIIAHKKNGKWVQDISDDPYMITYGWRCSECGGRQTYGTPNFCMMCGADMRKGGAE